MWDIGSAQKNLYGFLQCNISIPEENLQHGWDPWEKSLISFVFMELEMKHPSHEACQAHRENTAELWEKQLTSSSNFSTSPEGWLHNMPSAYWSVWDGITGRTAAAGIGSKHSQWHFEPRHGWFHTPQADSPCWPGCRIEPGERGHLKPWTVTEQTAQDSSVLAGIWDHQRGHGHRAWAAPKPPWAANNCYGQYSTGPGLASYLVSWRLLSCICPYPLQETKIL